MFIKKKHLFEMLANKYVQSEIKIIIGFVY